MLENNQGERQWYFTHWNHNDGGCTLLFYAPSEGNLQLDFAPQQIAILKQELLEPSGVIIPIRDGSLQVVRSQSELEFIVGQLTHTMNMNVPEWVVLNLLCSLP